MPHVIVRHTPSLLISLRAWSHNRDKTWQLLFWKCRTGCSKNALFRVSNKRLFLISLGVSYKALGSTPGQNIWRPWWLRLCRWCRCYASGGVGDDDVGRLVSVGRTVATAARPGRSMRCQLTRTATVTMTRRRWLQTLQHQHQSFRRRRWPSPYLTCRPLRAAATVLATPGIDLA